MCQHRTGDEQAEHKTKNEDENDLILRPKKV